MNIFVTHPNPALAATWLDDKRLNKMITESTQMLSTCIRYLTDNDPDICNELYRSTHPNHPCNVWIRESKANFMWLLSHAYAMFNTKACGTGKRHKAGEKLHTCQMIIHQTPNLIPERELTPFPNCAANKAKQISFQHIDNVYLAYRMYLTARWQTDAQIPKWSFGSRHCPDWALNELKERYGQDENGNERIPERMFRCYRVNEPMMFVTERTMWETLPHLRDEVYVEGTS